MNYYVFTLHVILFEYKHNELKALENRYKFPSVNWTESAKNKTH